MPQCCIFATLGGRTRIARTVFHSCIPAMRPDQAELPSPAYAHVEHNHPLPPTSKCDSFATRVWLGLLASPAGRKGCPTAHFPRPASWAPQWEWGPVLDAGWENEKELANQPTCQLTTSLPPRCRRNKKSGAQCELDTGDLSAWRLALATQNLPPDPPPIGGVVSSSAVGKFCFITGL